MEIEVVIVDRDKQVEDGDDREIQREDRLFGDLIEEI